MEWLCKHSCRPSKNHLRFFYWPRFRLSHRTFISFRRFRCQSLFPIKSIKSHLWNASPIYTLGSSWLLVRNPEKGYNHGHGEIFSGDIRAVAGVGEDWYRGDGASPGMEGSDHDQRACRQCAIGDPLLHHRPQAQSNGRDHSVPQRWRWLVGVLLRQVVD